MIRIDNLRLRLVDLLSLASLLEEEVIMLYVPGLCLFGVGPDT